MYISDRIEKHFGVKAPEGLEFHTFGTPYREIGSYSEYSDLREEKGCAFDNKGVLEIPTDNGVVIAYIEQDEMACGQDYWDLYAEGGKLHGPFDSADEGKAALEELKATGKPWFIVNHYDHSGSHFSIANSRRYPDRQWDVSANALYVPSESMLAEYETLKNDKGEEQAMEWLRGASNEQLDQFSMFSNGFVFEATAELWEQQGDTATRTQREGRGFLVGLEHALDTLNEVVKEVSPEDPSAMASLAA